MPSVLNYRRAAMVAAALAGAMLTAGCGGRQDAGNMGKVQMNNMETVDGTINDAMTDLDGVQSEVNMTAETGGNGATSARAGASSASNASSAAPGNAQTEVVADQ